MTPDARRTFRRRTLPPAALVCLYAALALAPLALAATLVAREEAFWRELCIGIGMVALALLLLQFVLSGRFEFLSGRTGIDLTMRFHQLAAISLAALVVLHPVLLVVPTAFEDPAAALRRLEGYFREPALATGVAAWLTVLLLVVTGVWRRTLPVPYEAWRLVHGIGAAAAAALAAHHAFRVGLYAELPLMTAFWGALLALAAGSFGYVYAVKPLLLWRHPYLVQGNERVAPDVWEIVLKPAYGSRLDFDAGQFAWVSFGTFPAPAFDHPFSIVSSPAQLPEVRFLIKESGDFTNRIGRLPVGTRAYLDAPHGNFTLRGRQGDSICLIAGGIGIAPVLSILRHLDDSRDRRPIALIFAARTAADLVHRKEIDEIASRLELTVTYAIEQPEPGWTGRTGIVDFAIVRAAVRCPEPGRCLALICGPAPMMVAVGRHLVTVGLPERQIVYERFVYD